jgi:predicted Zn-dependent protease
MTEIDVAARVVELAKQVAGGTVEAEAVVQHTALALTRFANSRIHQNVADATSTVRLRLHLDGRTSSGSTTLTDADGLRALVERTVAAARLCPPDLGWPGLAPPAPLTDAGFDEATAGASPDERAARVRDFVAAAEGLETAGYCRTSYTAVGFANNAGQVVGGRAAEAAMDGIARLGGADGVARVAGDRLAGVDGAALGARAAAKARAAGAPVELPPGEYAVVLEPAAVGDLLQNLAMFGFNGKMVAERQSFAEPGAQQFDPAITIVDDPQAGRGIPVDTEGTPRAPLTLVEAGVTRAVTHDRRTADEVGAASTGHATAGSRSWGPTPAHLRLEPGAHRDGPPAGGPVAGDATAALIAGMTRGLLISDLWYTRVLDPKALVVTGLTRNGVWLVEDGEVVAAVGNLRFTQSYPKALGPGAVLGVGSEAVTLPDGWASSWYTAPALHLASWQFTGNASG